ncbi:AMP-binding protein [Neptuniibacter sp. QD34_54]|uniref:AMP-binding protein n=1 Tax=Neptuniibacter sp. QD34_54 TaxID=3398208 RepID=UPI0039F50670
MSTDPMPTSQESALHVLHIVKQVAAELHPNQHFSNTLNLDSSLDQDFSFDSLGKVELLLRLEQEFRVALPESLLNRADTPRDLFNAILNSQARTKNCALPELEQVQLELKDTGIAPELAETLLDVLEWQNQHHPDQVHITLYDPEGEGQTISYIQLKTEALKVAAGLQALGLQPQAPVVLMLPTGAEYFYCFFGILYAAGIPCPIYPPGRKSQIEEHLNRHASIVRNSGAEIMITPEDALPFAALLRNQVTSLNHLVTPENLQQHVGELTLPKIHPRDIAFLQYTSGSTGTPKGVILTHANLLANVRAMGEAVQADANDVFVSWLPLYHDMGLIGAWFASLYHSAHLVIMSPLSFIARPQRWLEAIHRYHGTLSASPNFGYEHCSRLVDPKDYQHLDLSSWRCAFNGAEAVSPQTLETFCHRFSCLGFSARSMMPVYGLAENSVGLAFPPLARGAKLDCINRDRFSLTGYADPVSSADPSAISIVNCGQVIPGHQLRVADSRNRELPDRQEGHVQFKGPSATSGYYRNPEKTAGLFKGDWLETGDLGYIVDGELYITGRQKDLIILAGRNIHPSELENVVSELEGVRKGGVVAFGSQSEEFGTERLIIVAETRLKAADALNAIRSKINQASLDLLGLPADEICLVAPNQILKTSSGKVRRAACKALYESNQLGKRTGNIRLQWLKIGLASIRGKLTRFFLDVLDYAFAGYCWLVFTTLALVFTPIALLFSKLDLRWDALSLCIRLMCMLTTIKVKVEGLENLPAKGQPSVFVANHASYLDGYLILGFLPRAVRFVAKAELKSNKLVAFLLNKIGVEFVERFNAEQGYADITRLSEDTIEKRSLFFFPEGTFSRVPGLRSFHLGAFITACQKKLPVIPIGIRGSRNILRADSWFPRRGHIIISIGKPIYEPPEEGVSPWQSAIKMRDLTRVEILKLTGEIDLKSEEPMNNVAEIE